MGKNDLARTSTRGGIALLIACASHVVGCGDSEGGAGGSSSTSTDTTKTTSTTGTMNQSSSSTGVDPTCIPSEAAWSPSESCGVFVKAGASGDGKPGTPFGSIGEAVAMGGGRSIYVCEGTYTEGVQLAASENIFGGLVCDTWAYDATKRPVIASPSGAIGLHITGTGTHRIEDINIEADDADMPGGSSIGVFVHQATVDVARVDVTAGAGAMGAAGATEAKPPTPASAVGVDGDPGCVSSSGVFGPDGGSLTCMGLSVAGGAGGNGTDDAAGGPGADGFPNEAATGQGGDPQTDAPMDCSNGTQGRGGTAGTPGTGASASSIGTLEDGGYTGPEGSVGLSAGTPGQGGGGGGGGFACTGVGDAGPAGGGGGAGGCGGNPGAGGKGGGGSFAFVSVGATTSLTNVSLTAGAGGKGGTGDAGQEGMDGGMRGGPGAAAACAGGSGGKGGRGGAGGGGRGGPSVAIAYAGSITPTEGAGVMLTIAQEAAAGGDGGNGGATNIGGTGAAGILELRQAW